MKTTTYLLGVALLLASCGESNNNTGSEKSSETKTTTTTTTEKAPTAVKPSFASLEAPVSKHVNGVLEHYLHIKTALVNSNAAEARSGATALLDEIKGFDRSLLPADQKQAYDGAIGSIRSAATGISKESDIEKQREAFASLSTQLYTFAKAFATDKALYHQHCPMAMNDKGAMWLSREKEIKNPYYGEKMMECGTVEEIIEK